MMENQIRIHYALPMLKQSYVARIQGLLGKWPSEEINMVVEAMIQVHESKRMIYVIGNGGSASTSSHIVTDLGVGSLGKQNPIRAISLTDNSSVITATANDYSYAQIFERQIRLLCQEGDLVLAISASGNSVNLISAVKIAKELGCITVGMTGFDGGLLKKIVDISVHIQTAIGDYGPAEDLHMMFGHSITELIRQRVEL